MAEDDDFLSRWSRRKREQRAGLHRRESGIAPPATGEQEPPRPGAMPGSAPGAAPGAMPGAMNVQPPGQDVVPADVTQGGEPPPEAISADELAELEKTDLDALDYSSDYTAFMREGVPEALRRRALRRLWQSDPVLANIDGLNDYDEDFTDAALVVKALQSAYNVGRGYFTQEEIEEMQAQEAAEGTPEVVEGEDASQPEPQVVQTEAREAGRPDDDARTAEAGTGGAQPSDDPGDEDAPDGEGDSDLSG